MGGRTLTPALIRDSDDGSIMRLRIEISLLSIWMQMVVLRAVCRLRKIRPKHALETCIGQRDENMSVHQELLVQPL